MRAKEREKQREATRGGKKEPLVEWAASKLKFLHQNNVSLANCWQEQPTLAALVILSQIQLLVASRASHSQLRPSRPFAQSVAPEGAWRARAACGELRFRPSWSALS